jgi:hypothetical protein
MMAVLVGHKMDRARLLVAVALMGLAEMLVLVSPLLAALDYLQLLQEQLYIMQAVVVVAVLVDKTQLGVSAAAAKVEVVIMAMLDQLAQAVVVAVAVAPRLLVVQAVAVLLLYVTQIHQPMLL